MPSRLLVRVLSDVHSEFRPGFSDAEWVKLLPKAFAPEEIAKNPVDGKPMDLTCAILAGDIGHPSSPTYRRYLAATRDRFDRVFVVSGNHESYMQNVCVDQDRVKDPDYTPSMERFRDPSKVSIRWTDAWARQVCEETGCEYLQMGAAQVVLPDGGVVRLAGCTLWTHIPSDFEAAAMYSLTDFSQILDESGKAFTTVSYNALHRKHVAWLSGQIRDPETQPDIVITHHLPSFRLIHPKYRGSQINSCFASDTIGQTLLAKPTLWCAGHSHAFVRMNIGSRNTTEQCEFLVNPLGYPNEQSGVSFDLHVAVCARPERSAIGNCVAGASNRVAAC